MTEKSGSASQIGSLLRQLAKMYQTLMFKELKGLGLTPPQMLTILQVINGPQTIGEISRAVHLSYSTVSGIIDRLERDGLLERVRDEADRRIIWIRKTQKIDEYRGKLPLFQESFYNHLFDDLTEQDMEGIVQSLETLISHMRKKLPE